jgi:hypothetical protein
MQVIDWTGVGFEQVFILSSIVGIAEVVGSTPTRSIFYYEGTTGLNHARFRLLSDKTSSNALSKSDRKKFDEMFDIPRLYISQLTLL